MAAPPLDPASASADPAPSGTIFDVQRFSIHDGPGIRTTVFLKGCPLRCRWCHNPESIATAPQLSYLPARCIGCHYCLKACTRGGHLFTPEAHTLDRARCQACGRCAEACPAQALEMVGRRATVDAIIDEVLRDRPFYETSEGGMTLSGGEPLLQIAFSTALLRRAKDAGLHTAIETCGHVVFERFERVLALVDLFLFDLKETDPGRHRDFTGVDNALILANLRALHDRKAAIQLRCPIIPGCNDRDDHFVAVARLCASLPRLRGVEVMPYHPLGQGKIERFGMNREGRIEAQTPEPATVRSWREALRRHGATVIGGEG